MPLVSIVIPAHNAAPYLGGAIRSALGQSHREIEVVVVDDGSTDDTAAVAQAFGPPVRYVRQENAGPSAARNRGLSMASGEYVGFLDADDELDREWVAALLRALQGASPRARFAVSDAWLWSGLAILDRYRVSDPRGGERDLNAFLDDNRPYVAILAKSDLLRAEAGFRSDLWVNEDFHLWMRLLGGGHTYVHVPRPLYRYRYHQGSLSRDCLRRLQAACGLYEEMLAGMDLTAGQRRRIAYLLWRERARASDMAAHNARSQGRYAAWIAGETYAARAQLARFLLRPHFTLRRAWLRARGGAEKPTGDEAPGSP